MANLLSLSPSLSLPLSLPRSLSLYLCSLSLSVALAPALSLSVALAPPDSLPGESRAVHPDAEREVGGHENVQPARLGSRLIFELLTVQGDDEDLQFLPGWGRGVKSRECTA